MGDDEHVDRRAVARLGAAGLVLAAAAVATATGWVDWAALGAWLRPHLVVTALSGMAVLLLGGALRQLVPWRRWPRWLVGDRRPDRRVPPLSWWMVAAAAIVVAGVAWGATAALLHEANGAKDPAAARVDAIKTGLSIGAGTGGVFALLLAVRRQWHQELTAADATLDAEARRITELYTRAVDQLGSYNAPVRLGGLYALERLAQDNRSQRQTIVNVICAYLRMPYTPPADRPPADDAPEPEQTRFATRTQERQVRLTAQHILTTHLQPGPDPDHPATTFWSGTDLDLTGATLIDFDLTRCRPSDAVFDRAVFAGDALFDRAVFAGDALFDRAVFAGHALFEEAVFAGDALFDRAVFAGHAWFRRARFAGAAQFGGAEFAGATVFDGVRVRLDVPEDAAQSRAWPDGWTVVPTAERPERPDVEGEWGRLVKQAAPDPS